MDLEFEPGSVFDSKYHILSLLGRGGMGAVYKARQPELDRLVAIKILGSKKPGDRLALKRLEREASVLARLSDEHIARFYSFAISEDGLAYIAMEYVEGRTLRELMLDTEGLKLKEKQVIILGRQLCGALAKAHQAGIIHRDLKPENIILVETAAPVRAVLIDFGIAKLMQSNEEGPASRLTKTGSILGSVPYLAPELLQGYAPDSRSDIYSLALILYECLSGSLPFETGTQSDPNADSQLQLPSKRRGEELSIGLDQVVRMALRREPSQRYQSITEFDRDLLLVEQGRGTEIREGLSDQAQVSVQKKFLLIAVMILLLSILCFCSSPEGLSLISQIELRKSADESRQIYWLRVARDLERRGAAAPAAAIRQHVADSSKSELGLASLNTKLSRQCLDARDSNSAAFFACQSIKLLAKSMKSRHKYSHDLYDDLLETDCGILLASNCKPGIETWNDLMTICAGLGDNRNPMFHSFYSLIGQTLLRQGWRCNESAIDALELWLRSLISEGKYEQVLAAMPAIRSAVAGVSGHGNMRFPHICIFLARGIYRPGSPNDSELLYRLAKRSLSESCDLRSEFYPDILSGMAQLERLRGNLSEAEVLVRKSIRLSEESDQNRAVESYTTLASIQEEQGDTVGAITTQRLALDLVRKLEPPNDEAILRERQTACIGFAEQLIRGGKKTDAFEFIIKELADLQKLEPFPVEAVGRLRNWLAEHYARMGRISEAERLYEDNLELFRKYRYDEFAQCRDILNLLKLYWKEKKFHESELLVGDLFQKSDSAVSSVFKASGDFFSLVLKKSAQDQQIKFQKETINSLRALGLRLCHAPVLDQGSIEKILSCLKDSDQSAYLELKQAFAQARGH